MPSEETYTKYEDLADGTTLITLKQGYLKSRDKESLVSLLSCLRESFVWVPMTVKMSERDELRLKQAAEAKQLDSFKAQDEVRMRPEILSLPDGRRFFPMFSRKSGMPEEFRNGFSVFSEAVPNCIRLAKAMDGLNGLVLDAFTEPMILPFDVAEMVLNAQKMHG